MRKILSRVLLLIMIQTFSLYAMVELQAPAYVNEGESLGFSIVAKGFEVEFPKIEKIKGVWVDTLETKEELVIIGVTRAKKITKNYLLHPTKDITIPQFTLMIDGQKEQTKAQKIILKKVQKSHFSMYDVTMNLSKETIMIGEEVHLTVKFWYKDLEDYEVMKPSFKGCIVEEVSDKEIKVKEGYLDTLVYKIIPQSSGTITLHPIKVKVESQEKKYIDVYANALQLEVEKLPEETALIGGYTLKVWTETNATKRGEPIYLHIMIKGEGNLKHLENIMIDIPHTTIFEHAVREDEKVLAILAEEDFIVPALSLTFYDTKNQELVDLESTPIPIVILDSVKKSWGVIIAVICLIAFILGGILFYLNHTPYPHWIIGIKKAKDKEQVLHHIVSVLGKDKSLDRKIYRLEKSQKSEFKLLKKEILALAKKYHTLHR